MRRAAAFVGVLMVLALAPGAGAQQKKRVAVLDFDYGTVRNWVSSIFGTDTDVGKGVSDLLVEKLVAGGAYSVIERRALEKVLAEQNFSNSDRADANSAARIGRILGVDAIILGSITQLGRDDKSTGVGGGVLGGLGRRAGVGGFGRQSSKAVVAVSARLINTDTAEIMLAATGKGESKRSGVSLVGAGGGGAGDVDMRSSEFQQTILGEAVAAAVTSLAAQLDSGASSIPARQVTVQGLVADSSGGTLVLNIGSRAGVRVGDRLEVRRKMREIKDPATGRVIRTVEDKLGEVTITEVDEQSSVGDYRGASPARVGDTVKSKP